MKNQKTTEQSNEHNNTDNKSFLHNLHCSKKVFALLLCSILLGLILYREQRNPLLQAYTQQNQTPTRHITPTPLPLPEKKILPTAYHIFQTFNNCGPAALSMTLHFYGIDVSQEELGNDLRPYQVPGGDNDDKSVTLDELGEKAKEYGLIPYHRPMGNTQLTKQFIALNIPVLVRTWTKPNEDIGHYRVVKGYDDTTGVLIQDDSLQNKNLSYTYQDFNAIWKKFNYEYLVLVPKEKQKEAEQILGSHTNTKNAWQDAVVNSQNEIQKNPDDIYAIFNLSVALYYVGDYEKSVKSFEQVETKLPFRTLWYQIEPIEAYLKLGQYKRVLQVTEQILNNQNRAYAEAYVLRGQAYRELGEETLAKQAYEKAVFYNKNLLLYF